LKAAVVTFPGSNCDQDAIHVLRNLVGVDTVSVWHEDARFPEDCRLVVLPGGFSYGDALRSGAIARFSPVMAAVRHFADAGGHVVGVCNGFQVLLESGLLPGAMLQNDRGTFVCRRQPIRVETTSSDFTRGYDPGATLLVPVAHHEGRYFAPDDVLDQLEREDRVAFRYLDNPNGSVRDIAGILSANRRVLGLMPHPERAAEPVLGSDDGLALFQSVVDTLQEAA
jgi:phosphoribosylformylglycinamidine synthase